MLFKAALERVLFISRKKHVVKNVYFLWLDIYFRMG